MKNDMTITKEMADQRLDKFISSLMPQYSRAQWQRYITLGSVKVNGETVKTNYRLKIEDHIEITIEDTKSDGLKGIKMPLTIIYEDAWIVVLVKPEGISVHPGHGYEEVTLAHGLAYHFSELSQASGLDRPGIVHRLDKDTSGLLVIAKDDETHIKLAKAFRNREVYKSYTAIVHGKYDQMKCLNGPIGRHPVKRTQMMVLKEGKPSVSYLYPLRSNGLYTLLKVDIITGRTHQIRVHLSHDSHPIVGDRIYGPKKMHAKKLMLSATAMGFKHPQHGEYMYFSIPLPQHMIDFLRKFSA